MAGPDLFRKACSAATGRWKGGGETGGWETWEEAKEEAGEIQSGWWQEMRRKMVGSESYVEGKLQLGGGPG